MVFVKENYAMIGLKRGMVAYAYKQKLAQQFSDDRKSYTAGKQKLIDRLIKEANFWRSE